MPVAVVAVIALQREGGESFSREVLLLALSGQAGADHIIGLLRDFHHELLGGGNVDESSDGHLLVGGYIHAYKKVSKLNK